MRRLFNAILLLACFASLQASSGPGPKAATVVADSKNVAKAGAVRFRFENLVVGMEERDSMIVIFDRYDHTAAGIVHQMYAAGSDQSITITGIAAGKYYVTIQFIGLHRDHLEKIVTIRSRPGKTVRIKLTPSEAFSKKDVVIPIFHPDLSNLTVVRPRKHFLATPASLRQPKVYY